MKQEILITRDDWQVRIAVLEDGRLVEYFQEPRHLEGLVGNLYVGRISRILPGMASANAVKIGSFATLTEGTMVKFGQEEGDKGPQATWVQPI